MPKISDEKRAARRAQILDAAWICFQKEGLHATTMDDIIRASGLSAGAVYSYYPSKDELILAAVTTSLSGLRTLMQPLFDVRPPLAPAEFLRRATETIARFTAREGYDLKRIALLGWSEAQRNERLRATMQGFYLAFRDQIEIVMEQAVEAKRLDATVSAKDAAKTLLSAILGFVAQSAILGDVDPAEIAAGVTAFAASGRS
ncbi:MAG TPA: TetR/AcrR family transcriptional regulator [Bosea sp. (in: a-proteobacteria)]|jgi:AcrR family transcriptional regulator|uniref:TetR/AcrR family transcriptional regulator n=1 Tax=Bosea sp. (in: a-proteobacteria) TaxID=1871050 RepID=UPI002E1040BA|nr:TetR/AcrR family transcriptional regulator [Bosea sp. (in: a-proteobacteria)]